MNLRLKNRTIGLATKFNVLAILLVLVTAVGISLFNVRMQINASYQQLLNNAQTIAASTSRNCEYGVYTEDRSSLLAVVDSLGGNEDIVYAAVLTRNGNQLVSRTFVKSGTVPPASAQDVIETVGMRYQEVDDPRNGRTYIEILYPITGNEGSLTDALWDSGAVRSAPEIIGYLRLGLTREGLRRQIRDLLASAGLLTLLIVVAGSGLSVLFTRRIISPLARLKLATHEIAEGNFETDIDVRTRDEIADLAASFGVMRDRLRLSRAQVEERTRELTEANRQMAQEIAARKAAEDQLHHDAIHDALTGLPNRALFLDRLTHAIAIARRRKDYLYAVLIIDIDNFKIVNDSLGHSVGDQLLVSLGMRLIECIRPGDAVVRLGGDEFGILLEDITGMGNATGVAERIERSLASPFLIEGSEIFTTASIGIALSTAGYETPEEVLRDADIAMYQAKAGGRSRYRVFEPGMHERAVERLRLETDLRRAVERKEFEVHYQPIFDLGSNSLIGYEALVRWHHPQFGFISPADFIPVAEETGIIVSIDRVVLREACRQLREWQHSVPGAASTFVSVNLSNKQMAQPDLVDYVMKVLKETDLRAACLKLEVTENVIIENPEATAEMLRHLRSLGVQIYIDDFGTGYSSLSYLHRLPIDGFKIDRSFIRRMGPQGENQEIVRTILVLARDLRIHVIAEGIETREQLELIRTMQCEYGQGFLFSKPVESAQARTYLSSAA